MSGATGIQWTDSVWNPGIYGCDEVSPGCANCYAAVFAHRLAAMGDERYAGLTRPVPAGGRTWTGEVRIGKGDLLAPLHWRKPRRVFVNSMSDLFHESVPDEHLDRVFAIMLLAHQHTFQILTKRPERMRAYLAGGGRGYSLELFTRWLNAAPPGSKLPKGDLISAGVLTNVWLGTSAEDQARADERIPILLDTPAAVRFVSYEPALGPVDFRKHLGVEAAHDELRGLLHWLIVGGESGPRARPFDLAWARSTVAQCREAGVAAFYKQGGASNRCPHSSHGGHFECFPADLQVREFPAVRA